MRNTKLDKQLREIFKGEEDSKIYSFIEQNLTNNISSRDLEILRLRILEDKTNTEIADIYGISSTRIQQITTKMIRTVKRYKYVQSLEYKGIDNISLNEILIKYNCSVRLFNCILRAGARDLEHMIQMYNRVKSGSKINNLGEDAFNEWTNILESIKKDYDIEYIPESKDIIINKDSSFDDIFAEFNISTRLVSNLNKKYNHYAITICKTDIERLSYLYHIHTNANKLRGIGPTSTAEWDKLMNTLKDDYNIDWKEITKNVSTRAICPFDGTICSKNQPCTLCDTHKQNNPFGIRIIR